MPFLFLLVCVLLMPRLAAVGFAGPADSTFAEPLLSAASRFVDTCRKVREEKYGNVHFVVVETHSSRDAAGKEFSTATEQKFWSRDNKYFRLDATVTKSNNPRVPIGERRRMIVQPEGYVEMLAWSAGEPYTIRNWGTTAEGINLLFGKAFIQSGIRFAGIFDADVVVDALMGGLKGIDTEGSLSKELGDSSTLRGIELSSDESEIEFRYTGNHTLWHSDPNTTEANLVCNVSNGVVVQMDARNYNEDGSLDLVEHEDKTYDFSRFGCYPFHHKRTRVIESEGYSEVSETTLQSIEWNTETPLGVFSLEAQGLTSLAPESVWSRRLWVVFYGLALFGIVYLVKRVHSRASE